MARFRKGWPTGAPPRVRLPHPSRFSTGVGTTNACTTGLLLVCHMRCDGLANAPRGKVRGTHPCKKRKDGAASFVGIHRTSEAAKGGPAPYSRDGSLNTLTYPSGDVVSYNVGGAERATQATDSTNNYAMSAKYAPQRSPGQCDERDGHPYIKFLQATTCNPFSCLPGSAARTQYSVFATISISGSRSVLRIALSTPPPPATTGPCSRSSTKLTQPGAPYSPMTL